MKHIGVMALCLFALAAPTVFAQDTGDRGHLDICAVTSDASHYDGKVIVVNGFWRMIIHGSLLMGKACPKVEVNLTETPGYKADKKAAALARSLVKNDQFASVDVVLRGTFRVAKQEQCFGQVCAPYQFDTSELISAQAPQH